MRYEHGPVHGDFLRHLREPEDLQALRRQLKRIEEYPQQAMRRHFDEMAKQSLRRKIKAAGEVPCR